MVTNIVKNKEPGRIVEKNVDHKSMQMVEKQKGFGNPDIKARLENVIWFN